MGAPCVGDHFLHPLSYVETDLPRLPAALPLTHLTAIMPTSWKAGKTREKRWDYVCFFT